MIYFIVNGLNLTLKMTSAQVVETSVNVISNSPSQDYTHPDDRTLLYDLFYVLTSYTRPHKLIALIVIVFK